MLPGLCKLMFVHLLLLVPRLRSGLLSNPLRDRFVAQFHYDFYNSDEIRQIIELNSNKLNMNIENRPQLLWLQNAREEPLESLTGSLARVRDFSLVNKSNLITESEVKSSLGLMQIDEFGLDRMDRKILTTIRDFFNGGRLE